MFYVGVDLGKRGSSVCVLDDSGEVFIESKLNNTKAAFHKFIRSLGNTRVEAVCETGNKCFWLSDIMEEIGAKCTVANAYKVKLIAESTVKTDKIDAKILAELLRIAYIPKVYIPPKEHRTWKEIVRGRGFYIIQRTQLYNRIHAILDRYAIEYKRSQLHNKGAHSWLLSIDVPAIITRALTEYSNSIDQINEHVKAFEREVKEKIKVDNKVRHITKLLMTIPGIGWLTAIALYMELVDITRFKTAKKLCSYIGIVPGTYRSSQINRDMPLTKQGNSFLRSLMVEDAWVAIRHDNHYRMLYWRHSKRLGNKQAILPVARSLLYAIHRVWTEQKPYQEIFNANKHKQTTYKLTPASVEVTT